MNDRKAFAYFRVGNAEQLGETTDNRVFLYCRQSYDDSPFMNQQQEHLLRHCAEKGYLAAGSTAVVKQILRIVAGLFRTLVVVFVLPNGKQHSRSNLRKGEQDEDYGNHNRETTDSHQNQIGSLLQSIK